MIQPCLMIYPHPIRVRTGVGVCLLSIILILAAGSDRLSFEAVQHPLLIDFLVREEGFSRSQSFGRGRWLTVGLDGTVPLETVCYLVNGSFLTTAAPKTRQKYRPPKEWVVPSNLKHFDSTTMFDETDVSV